MKTLDLRWDALPSGAIDDPHANGEYALLRVLGPHLYSVVDAGANVGAWTWKVQMVSQGSAHVLAIEPQRELAKTLRKRFEYLDHIRILNCALGAAEGIAVLKSYAGKDSGMSGLIQRGEAVQQPIDGAEPVAVMTLDGIWKSDRNIDLLKIDVEGAESAVIRGAYKLLSDRRIRFIQFEYGGCWSDAKENLVDIVACLNWLRYNVGTITPEGIENGWGEEDYRYRNLFAWKMEELCETL